MSAPILVDLPGLVFAIEDFSAVEESRSGSRGPDYCHVYLKSGAKFRVSMHMSKVIDAMALSLREHGTPLNFGPH